MTTFAITEETPNEEVVTQAEEKIFIHDLPVMYKMGGYQEPELATYNCQYLTGNLHSITLPDGKTTSVRSDEITPSRQLSDTEMIYYLTDELLKASEQVDNYKKLYSSAQDDLEKISDALSEEAENRGWCSEYNEFCNQVNDGLTIGFLKPLTQEYSVDFEIQASVTLTRTIYVTASSQEEAEGFFSEDPEAYIDPEDEAFDGIKSSGWDNVEVNVT